MVVEKVGEQSFSTCPGEWSVPAADIGSFVTLGRMKGCECCGREVSYRTGCSQCGAMVCDRCLVTDPDGIEVCLECE